MNPIQISKMNCFTKNPCYKNCGLFLICSVHGSVDICLQEDSEIVDLCYKGGERDVKGHGIPYFCYDKRRTELPPLVSSVLYLCSACACVVSHLK